MHLHATLPTAGRTRRPSGLRWSVILAIAFGLSALGLLAAPPSVLGWSSESFSSADESELVALTNQARASAGLPALVVDSTLHSIARWRSKDMSDRDYFSHDIPDPPGGKVFDEMDRRGYCYTLAGENIGWNTYPDSTATQEIQNAFMASSGHRANILGSRWDHIGIGAYKNSSGKHYWTVLFADKCGSTPKPTPRPTPKPTPRPTPKPTAKPTPKPTPTPTAQASDASSPEATPPPDTIAPSDAASGDNEPTDVPGPGGSGGGSQDGIPRDTVGTSSFRVVDPPASQGLFETIVGGVAGFFFGT